MLVSDSADARAFRHEPPKVVSALAGMVINSAEMVTRLTKVIWSIAKTIDVLRCGYPLTQYGQQKTAHCHQQAAHCHRQAAHSIGVLRCGHPLGCEKLWGNREENEGTGVADGGAWERKKRVDIADWLCLHAFIIDHKKSGILFTSLLHPSRCKPTCSTRLHERSRHQRR